MIDNIFLKFHNHPSIQMIKHKLSLISLNNANFSFQQVTLGDVRKAI